MSLSEATYKYQQAMEKFKETSAQYDSSINQAYDTAWVSKANELQIAGNHYKQFKGHEPWDVVLAWGLGYLDGTALKYISRWRHKGGIEDIKKAIHFLQKLLEEEEKNNGVRRTSGCT